MKEQVPAPHAVLENIATPINHGVMTAMLEHTVLALLNPAVSADLENTMQTQEGAVKQFVCNVPLEPPWCHMEQLPVITVQLVLIVLHLD